MKLDVKLQVWACALAFAFGMVYAWVLIRYYSAIQEKQAKRAAIWDLVLGECAVLPLQIWFLSGGSPMVLQAEILGSAVGTWLALK